MTRSLILAAAVALASLTPAVAQPIDVRDLDALFDSPPRVEVNLRGSLLRLAAEAARSEEPSAAGMLDGLRSVIVRIYPSQSVSRLAVDHMTGIGLRFEDQGWLPLVRIRSLPNDTLNDGDVWVYVLDDGDSFDGMAVMAIDEADDDAVFVLIDGTIDPAQVGALSRRFAKVDIDGSDEDPASDDDN